MRKPTQGLTHAEWYLMEALWESAPLTGREMVEKMEASQHWNRSTTLTMLRRMTEKGQLRCDEREGLKVYSPLIDRESALMEETDSFLNRAYHGSISLMVSALTKKQSLSKEEIDELYAILRSAEGKE